MFVHQPPRPARDRPISATHGGRPANKAQNMFWLKTVICEDTKRVKRHAHDLGAHRSFGINHILRSVIGWTVSVDRSNWSSLVLCGKTDVRTFKNWSNWSDDGTGFWLLSI